MKQRRLGRTGVQISELVFGGGWVGGILIHQDDDTKREAVTRALDAGINWIDTAPSYGDGRSETALGWLLKETASAGRPAPRISTKVRLDLARPGSVADQVERSLEDSLRRLQLDSVELLQLHNPIAPASGGGAIGIDAVLGEGGAAHALERVREQGLTRWVGITALGDAGACAQAVHSGRFDTAQVYYNLLNPSAGGAVPASWSGQDFGRLIERCKSNDVGVMAIRVLAAGVIASDERHGREIPVARGSDIPAEEARARRVFEVLGDAYGTRSQTALRFVLAHEDIACAVVGMAELDHLEQAIEAARMGPLPGEAIAALEALHSADFAG